ncbi:hypothetical protein TRFO_15741 [Tritrichomonas foetus]|uniref:Peptidase M60 domain-containing protein n=1 Tax=Tritrichomonas foetus TaxID=1144522 RepID=A0A1J4KS91_9EUKA|nr:hypothetical protein TRFO_15741 [Tritrichomonas foetus]|eukprot:OHT13970.1 hypothetical protein TRFO_15741 [Tritrichomonas foetus]
MIMLFIHLFLSLITCTDDSSNYIRSIFGAPGVDEVEIDIVDGFEVIETGLPKPTTKHIWEGRFTTTQINDSDYPWPDKSFNGTCNWTILQNETSKIRSMHQRCNVTQDELYKHPVAAKQYFTTDEELKNADRVKVKYVVAPKYNRHVPPVFIPPGEVCTIEYAVPGAAGTLTLSLNTAMHEVIMYDDGSPKSTTRLNDVRILNVNLANQINTIGSPYGGAPNFVMSVDHPIEVTISGVILCPWFKYGMHSDEEWENEISKLPGPYAHIDTGNMLINIHASFVRSAKRMNDCMKFYRSAYQISQSIAYDKYTPNQYFTRPTNILQMNYDSFVPYGSAVAFIGSNYCHFPNDWIEDMLDWEIVQKNPWGIVHEMNHHHQKDWCLTQDAIEMSNNALNLVIYAQTNQASFSRTESGGLSDWPYYSTLFSILNNDDSYGLSRYSCMLHYFGLEKFKLFVRSDQSDLYYPRATYGNAGAEMLRASKIFNRNMRYHWNFHGTDDSTLFSYEETEKELNNLNVEDFHPVATSYGCGFINDDEIGYITIRPFQIPPSPYVLNFNSTMRQRENTQWFGDFEFIKVETENGRADALEEIGFGRYRLTPKDSITEIEEVIAHYRDKTTKKTTKIICQFIQKNNYSYFERYENISDYNTIFEAYQAIIEGNETLTYQLTTHTLISSPTYIIPNDGKWLSITKGMIVPQETSQNFVFAVQADEMALFYLSETPLANDPDIDEPHLINYQKTYNTNYNNGNHSNLVSLVKGKLYYYVFVIYNKVGQGGGSIGFRTNSTSNFVQVDNSWLRYKECSEKEVFDKQYSPDFEKIYLMDQWDGSYFISQDLSSWNVYKHPLGDVFIDSANSEGSMAKSKNITDVWTDGDPTTEFRTKWWSGNGPIQLMPHIYEIDMGKTYSFSHINIGRCGNPNYFDLESDIEIKVAPDNFTTIIGTGNESSTIPYTSSNYSLNHDEATVFDGHFIATTPIVSLGRQVSGRYLRITIFNNTKIWKDNYIGRSSISAVEVGTPIRAKKIYPMTNTKILKLDSFEETRASLSYNGKGFTGKKGSKLTITLPKGLTEIGIIDDYYPSMGTAKVKINKKDAGTIHDSISKQEDNNKLKYSTKAHKSLLFFTNVESKKENTITVEVTDGEITLAGIITDENVVTYQTDLSRNKDISYSVSPKKKKLSSGAVAAIVIVVLLVVAVIAVGIFLYIKRPPFIEKLFGGGNESRSSLFGTV